ncbi:ATP-dependent endonuclease [Pseudarthrobacter sp. NPDC058362]|uniref:ATP-dependent nuclease n=1 Tax=Pseudarthrobacter sp. NPDC058362 TaxID=3346458 RepID=UPI0036551BF6
MSPTDKQYIYDMPIAPVELLTAEIFPATASNQGELYIRIDDWEAPVTYFVGRNGSGKSKAAKLIAQKDTSSLYLSTDRLLGVMSVNSTPTGATINEARGVALDDRNASHYEQQSRLHGMATEQMLVLRKQPDVALRVAAFLRRALGRVIELRETSGYLDPFVRVGNVEYSLFRDEGHGLRELIVLLTAVYRSDWQLLVVDEPELHLHPSMARLWVSELMRECEASGRRALIVTHEPSVLAPSNASELSSIWFFDVNRRPSKISSHFEEAQATRVTAGLTVNNRLISQLVFAPRPVLVEGPHDVRALSTALARTKDPAVVAQTEFVPCGSSNAVALWFAISRSLGLDVRAVADLDAIFSSDVQKTIDRSAELQRRYRDELYADPPATHTALRPLIEAADRASVKKDERSRARWLADLDPAGSAPMSRRDKILEVWRAEGLWLHPQGTLEDVLGIEKGKAEPDIAAAVVGEIDAVSDWCAFELDPRGEVEHLLGAAVERIANAINHAQGIDPLASFNRPVGTTSSIDEKLVDIQPLSEGRYRLTVKLPVDFAGYWMDFDRATSSNEMRLRSPQQPKTDEMSDALVNI